VITLPEALALVMLAALVIYAALGGADFGGGVWDLLATGPRAAAQRKLIEQAIAPVWEANHVWLILVVVILFTAFPPAFSAMSTALHVPLTLMLLGIVFRGSAFVFRQYGGGGQLAERRWGRVFAVASTLTPIFLGVTIGALTAGTVRIRNGIPVDGFFAPWLHAFPFTVGVFALSLFAFLAAVYLAVEAVDPAVREDFRRRALASGLAVGLSALASGVAIGPEAVAFEARLFGSWWSWPLQVATGAAAVSAFAALLRRRYRLARLLAIGQTTLILTGWGLAQQPHLIAPDVTIQSAAAPAVTLRLLVPALLLGAVVLFPSLYWLLRIFKSQRSPGPS
jgi:cytochrome bd ubiquinol oxidase subunit II